MQKTAHGHMETDVLLETLKQRLSVLPHEEHAHELLYCAADLIETAGYEFARASGPTTATRFILISHELSCFLRDRQEARS